MFKIFLLLILFIVSVFGTIVEDKVKNIIGVERYNQHQKLIKLKFGNEENFIVNGKINYFKFFRTLQKNGLLNLKLDKIKNINIVFKAPNSSFKIYKIIDDTIKVLGYRYFFTKKMGVDKDKFFLWSITFRAEYMLDPVELLGELLKDRVVIDDITIDQNGNWIYKIDFENSILHNSYKIEKNEKVIFHKPLKPYMLSVEDPKSIKVISRKLNNWFPYIVFFDKDLNILEVIKKNKKYKGLKVDVPSGTKYIKITDRYNLINIKRGLSIIVR